MAEILDAFECDDGQYLDGVHVGTIYITPPSDEGDETDGDSRNEECADPDQLSRRQLQAEAELVIPNGKDEDGKRENTSSGDANGIA